MTPLEQKIEQLAAGDFVPLVADTAYRAIGERTYPLSFPDGHPTESAYEAKSRLNADALKNAATVAVQAEVIEMLVGLLEKAELLTVSGADIFNSEGSRLLRISNAQREEALRIAAKLGVG